MAYKKEKQFSFIIINFLLPGRYSQDDIGHNMIIEKCGYFEYEYIKEPFLDIHSFTSVTILCKKT